MRRDVNKITSISFLYKKESILEPSAGDGVFIDKTIKQVKKVNIVAYDINPKTIEILNLKYRNVENVYINGVENEFLYSGQKCR